MRVVKIGCISVIGLFVFLGILGAAIGGNELRGEGSTVNRNGDSLSVNDFPRVSVEQSVQHANRIGERVILGDYAYTIHQYKSSKSIGNTQFWGESAGDGAVFVIVDYTIENLTKESQTVLADDFELLDAKDRKFSSSSDATSALLYEDGQDFHLSELQPGLPHRTKTAFKVPSDAVSGDLRILIPEKGLFSTGKVVVVLN